MGLEDAGLMGSGGPTFLTTKLDFIVNWARRSSLWPMRLATRDESFGGATCTRSARSKPSPTRSTERFVT